MSGNEAKRNKKPRKMLRTKLAKTPRMVMSQTVGLSVTRRAVALR